MWANLSALMTKGNRHNHCQCLASPQDSSAIWLAIETMASFGQADTVQHVSLLA